MQIHNFWKAIEQWKEVIRHRNNYTSFCGLCFKPECDCGVEFIPYEFALSELAYWADINIMEAVNAGDGFVQDNQGYDRDHVYPYLPKPVKGTILAGVENMLPKDEPLSAYIVRGDRQWFYQRGKIRQNNSAAQHLPGITWGIQLDQFYPLARYDYPHWHAYAHTLPYGVPILMKNNVPNYKMRVVYK